MSDQPAPFVCAYCGIILGEKYREPNRRLTQLRVYRHPRTPAQGLDDSGDAEHFRFAVSQVPDGSVYCECCGKETMWYASGAALTELFERRKARTFGLAHG